LNTKHIIIYIFFIYIRF